MEASAQLAALKAAFLAPLAVSSACGLSISSIPAFRGRILADLSAGVLLSVAWLHLLVDAMEKLEGLSTYPAANASMLAGFLVMAGWQFFLPCHHTVAGKLPLLHPSESPADPCATRRRFHMLEVAVSFHSILIGVGFGFAETGWQQQLELSLALCVHQFLEGLAIGSLGRQCSLGSFEWIRTYLIFSFSLPFGALAALGVQVVSPFDDQSTPYRWASGLLSAFASGTLTYIGVAMLMNTATTPPPIGDDPASRVADASERGEGDAVVLEGMSSWGIPACMLDEPRTKLLCSKPCGFALSEDSPLPRLLATFTGAALMAVLAIWA